MGIPGVPGTGEKFFYNVRTRQVERGPESAWTDRLGPYDTYDGAASALDRARERSVAWDEQDEAEDDWGAPDGSARSGGAATGTDLDDLA